MATGLFNLKQVNQAISQGAWSGYIAPRWVEYLVVAGGGGAGGSNQNASGTGGGGGGGLLTGIVTVAAGASYTVTVGAGGAGGSGTSGIGQQGVSSVFGNISTTGGGGSQNAFSSGTNINGGSGAGSNNANNFGQGTSGQGNQGGASNGTAPTYGTGGGGGAGTVGSNSSAGFAGNGGAGIASAITGSVVAYAGGGGGGLYSTTVSGGVGGAGGGGTGGANSGGTNGGGNTGGGGGAASGGSGSNVPLTGASGGSGIVVVRYPGNVQFYTGGTVTYSNGYIVHNFTANGTLAPTTPTVVSEYQISRSLRFNAADSNTLTRTPATAGSRTTYSLSFWIKNPFTSGSDNPVWGQFSIARESLAFQGFSYAHNPIQWIPFTGFEFRTTQAFRDNSAWYHVVAVGDSTNATPADRARLYINGVRVTAFDLSSTITQNAQTGQLNTAVLHYIGKTWSSDGAVPRFYLTEVNFVDGQALTPTSFGYVNPTTGIWSPAKYVGGYGTNGFYLNFSDNSNTTAATLGADYSGNGNNWTPNNFSVTAGAGNDSLVDSPTSYGTDTGVGGTVRGNYSTMNPLNKNSTATMANGNLDVTTTSSGLAYNTIGMSSGKWYWEVQGTTGDPMIGIGKDGGLYDWKVTDGYGYYGGNGQKYTNSNGSSYGATYTTSDIIGVALDMDAGTLTFYKNGTSQGTAFSSLTGTFFANVSNVGGSSALYIYNFGQRPFAYTAPSGFKALCTQNLPTPTIGATASTLANLYYDASLYTGTNATQSITNAGFQPDWVWIKARSIAYAANIIDSVRGSHKVLIPSSTAAEATSSTANGITAFNSNGFTLGLDTDTTGSVNASGQTFVAWQWKANGGTGVTNTAGSITSTVSANTTAGFSIVTYSANGTSGATVGHGLGTTPVFVIIKNRSAVSHWRTGTSVTASAASPVTGYLSTTSAFAVDSTAYQTLGSTTITLGNSGDVNSTSGGGYVAYCFAPIAGYSAFGSYTGNGSTDGPFVYTGFRPAFLMIKRSSSTGDWFLYNNKTSTYNVVAPYLVANTSGAEGTYTTLDFVSNGFKLRVSDAEVNGSGSTIIFMAFAENPFKTSLAR
jgi:hypothetical protein